MSVFWLSIVVLGLGLVGFVLAMRFARASAARDGKRLHSRLSYYGANAFICTIVPAFGLLIVWLLVQPLYVESQIYSTIPETAIAEGSTRGLVMSNVRNVADGLDTAVEKGVMSVERASSVRADLTDVRERLGAAGVALGSDVSTQILQAAQRYRAMSGSLSLYMTLTVLAVAVGGFIFALMRTHHAFRARNVVEKSILSLLIFAASVAILTTVGIVLSLIFNTINFFGLYPAGEFFTSLTWAPSFGGGSELGVIPLLWGTFYISLIALAVAVPVGLFAAVYLSEYAPPVVRSVAKPLIEILAGIPTIVYGLFALLTVGPLLVDVFGANGGLGLGWMRGASAVMTAGLVMGIMLIPFVSSLSDDIINAVPQAMRDGSLGLGATKSETIRAVVLPAALPGIVGAILLAASRAIGETMIVVLGAGAAARLSMNPFEAMTTVTAKIVSQLTGDADFASPEALVAFALGMTLFVLTLALNVAALYIVRKYREQYE